MLTCRIQREFRIELVIRIFTYDNGIIFFVADTLITGSINGDSLPRLTVQ